MTNAEKFEEVFGIKIDEYPDELCSIANDKYCTNSNACTDCTLFHFWSKEYDNKTGEDRMDVSKVFALGALFGTVAVATSDVKLSMIMKELENMEVREDD